MSSSQFGESGGTYSSVSDAAARDVVQAGNISGGVHFHPAAAIATPIPRQLPRDVHGFVDRVRAIERLDAVLAEYDENPRARALVVITGTAGVGKTSLAVRWAHQVHESFPDGHLYLNLRGYDPNVPVTPADALGRFLHALGVPAAEIPSDPEERAEQYRTLIAERRMLVILDNAASVRQVRPLLPGTSSTLTVITSRSRLSGLAARDGAVRLTVGLLTESHAADLVRATVEDYRRADSEEEVAQLAALCARLPLALRIAAERAAARPMMPLAALIDDLRGESSLWDALSSDDEADAVRSVFAWSYRTLPPDAARLFRLLGLHQGLDVSVGAAAALCGEPERATHRLMDHLAGAHLIEQTGPDRYQFHDLLRAYAADHVQHDEPASIEAAFERMFSWYLHTAAAAVSAVQTFFALPPLAPVAPAVSPHSFGSAEEADSWYQTERANLRAAAQTAAGLGLDEVVWQLAAVLDPIHSLHNPFDDWLAHGKWGLESARTLGDRKAEALMQATLGVAYVQSGRIDQAAPHLSEALEIHGETGDTRGELNCLNALGWVHLRARRFTEAADEFEKTAVLGRSIGDGNWQHIALCNLSTVKLEEGDLHASADYARRFLHAWRESGGDERLEFDGLWNLARIAREQDRIAEAGEYIQAAVSIADAAGPSHQAMALLEEGRLRRCEDRFEEAMSAFQRAATLYRTLPDRVGEAMVLGAVGELYEATGRPEQAVDFHRQAAALSDHPMQNWRRANAYNDLAGALRAAGEHDDSERYWTTAKDLLADYTDQRAAALRERILTALGEEGGQPV
ncbi:ATP-binding protein [Nocardiopsis sediminis]|uniref:ATP-binding protein n=1 Tax=Nocardiopsis sediminis TaxID=1778267 RepID=A0ABV8FLN0_9ACTN